MIDEYVDDEMLQLAARIGYQFKQNVIDILRSPTHEWLMWTAAYQIIGKDKAAEAEAMKSKTSKGRRK